MVELEGRTLDRYTLKRLIGRGGMANVYEGFDPSMQRVVAIKVFKREDEDMLRRFIREAEVMARLHHPHLVEVFDTGECLLDGVTRYYIVMPLLTGGTLRMRIRRNPLTLAEVCQCLSDIAGALDYIHSEGIVHRDIKASNVLLNGEGRCYLTDFGIARITADATQLTTTGNVLGTVDYVAPELFEVHHRANALSDLYSLGVLLYEMVTGRLPFSADNQLALISMHVNKLPPAPRQFVPDLSSQVQSVILRALEKKPEGRYASASELTEAFIQAVRQSGISVPSSVRPGTNPGRNASPELARATISSPPRAAAANEQGLRPSPPAGGTEGFVLEPQERLVLSGPPETPPPLTPPFAPRPPKRRSRPGLIVAACLLIIALGLIGFSGYSLLEKYNQSQSTPTAQAGHQQSPAPGQGSPAPDATSTAQAAATAGAHATAAAVSTATARATATMGPVATATAGQPAYQDPLTDANSSAVQSANWDQDSQCFFAGDGYHITQPASASVINFKGCREQTNNYGNFALSVNVKLLSGHSGGVYFRLSTNLLGHYDGYLFEIDGQGNYKISSQQGNAITALQDWTASSVLHTGLGATNLLQLIARENVFQLYANGHFLVRVTDPANNFSTSDQTNTIGFLATSTQGGSTAEVVYSNLKVYTLS